MQDNYVTVILIVSLPIVLCKIEANVPVDNQAIQGELIPEHSAKGAGLLELCRDQEVGIRTAGAGVEYTGGNDQDSARLCLDRLVPKTDGTEAKLGADCQEC